MYALESDLLSFNPSPNHLPAVCLSFLVCKNGENNGTYVIELLGDEAYGKYSVSVAIINISIF